MLDSFRSKTQRSLRSAHQVVGQAPRHTRPVTHSARDRPADVLAHAALLLSLVAPAHPADSVRTDRDVRLTALRHVADVRRCYEREGLTRDPGLTGTLDITVTVLATGTVRDAVVSSSAMHGLGAREVAACLTTAIRNWRFDRGPYVVESIVFPFRFAPTLASPDRLVS
jgi:hypothetical protein